ncbi:nucleolar and coiled-body phosphoprotein 1-like [Phycodurus eques]|uniref:nucleolar and coiled-body phosphoprotein 1-like n=1 Tax=Phycodurus eques TaxID=693459 RepID=UPI002ACEE60F|nr:nucleolar and coiled-body phosphoprotein 1-like [Phycodurus eques]
MADLVPGCSSSVVENQKVEMRENIPPRATVQANRQYLYEEYFPDITLIDVTHDFDRDQTKNDLSLLKTMPKTPLTERTLVRKSARVVEIPNDPTLTPRMEENKASVSQPRNLDTNASMFWLDNECLPDITECSFDSITQQSINFTINLTASDMQFNNSSQKAAVDSNLERVETLNLDEATNKTSKPSCPSQITCPQNDDGKMLESSSSDCHRRTFEAKFPSPSKGTAAMSESSSTDCHHNTLDKNPASQSNSIVTMAENSSNDSHHNTFDAKLLESSNKITLSQSTSNDSHHNTLDSNPPSQTNGTITMPESNSSNSCCNNLDSNPPSLSSGTLVMSESRSSHQNTFDAKPPESNGTITLFDSSSGDIHRNTFDAKPPKANGTISMSESRSSDGHHSTFDANGMRTMSISSSSDSQPHTKPPTEPSSTDANADAKVVEHLQGKFEASVCKAAASRPGQCEAKDNSQSQTFDQSVDPDDNSKAFYLDDIIDFTHENLCSSTPLTCGKMVPYAARPDKSKLLAAQERPYGDAASKPEVQMQPHVPPNITSGRKISLSQPAVKSLPPSSKAPSLLMKFKPTTLLPGRGEVPASGLPLSRQILTSTLQESSAVSSSSNLRATTTVSRLPKSGVGRPLLSGRPSSLPHLRQPSTRSSTLASSSADKKPSNAVVNIPQARKRDLSRDGQFIAKKKTKTGVPTSCSHVVAPAPSADATSTIKSLTQATQCQRAPTAKTSKDDATVSSRAGDAVTRTKKLKLPVMSQRTQLAISPGCAKCSVLEQQFKIQTEELQRLKEGCAKCSVLERHLKMQTEEVQRLKEELLRKQEEDV